FAHDPPRFMARTPHGYHDPERIRADVTAAAFTSISIETRQETREAETPRAVAIAYCQGTPLRNEIEARDASRLGEATEVATEALAQRFGRDAVDGKIQAHIV